LDALDSQPKKIQSTRSKTFDGPSSAEGTQHNKDDIYVDADLEPAAVTQWPIERAAPSAPQQRQDSQSWDSAGALEAPDADSN
jgi:hypothetical protein